MREVPVEVNVTRIDPDLPLPAYATSGSVGVDLHTRETTTIAPRTVELVPGNVILSTPPGCMWLIAARSSTPRKKGLFVPHGVGIIDQDYCGPEDEVKVQVWNPTDREIVVERGERIAQAILVRIEKANWHESATTQATTRGGFGSTG